MSRRAGITKAGCLTFIVVFVAAVYISIPIGKAYFRYLNYKDAIKQELRFRSAQPDSLIKRSLRLAADSLGLPEEASDVTITRKDGQITIEAEYQDTVKFPGYQKAFRFQPRAAATY